MNDLRLNSKRMTTPDTSSEGVDVLATLRECEKRVHGEYGTRSYLLNCDLVNARNRIAELIEAADASLQFSAQDTANAVQERQERLRIAIAACRAAPAEARGKE